MQTKNSSRFLAEYLPRLRDQVSKRPDQYGYPDDECEQVARRMIAALARGGANKDSPAIRSTCKALGIPYTYAGIQAFLCEAEPASSLAPQG